MTKPDGVIVLTCEYAPFPGGIGTYAGQLVNEVRKAGFAAMVLAPDYPDLPQPAAEPDTHRILRHHQISPVAALNILSRLKASPPDRVFLAADIRSVLLASLLKPLHRRPFRAMIHGSEVSKLKQRNPLTRLASRGYRTADVILANSKATLDLFAANFGDPFRSAVTYLGVDESWFEPATGGFEHPDLAALPAGASVICTVGRIEARKGHSEALRIIARAQQAYGLHDPVFVMPGMPEDQTYADAVQVEARSLGVRAIAPGRLSQDDLRRLYARAACQLLCAREIAGKIEGFGLVLLEAAAQGCPSVATRVGGISEVMGETGFLAAADDFDGMARAVAAYALDADLRRAHGMAALRRAETFTWAECARRSFPELWRS